MALPHALHHRWLLPGGADRSSGKSTLVLYLWVLVLIPAFRTAAQGYNDEREPAPSELMEGREAIVEAWEPVRESGNRTAADRHSAWLPHSEASRERVLRGRRTWKLGEVASTGSRSRASRSVMRIVDLTVPTVDASAFRPPTGGKKLRDALEVDPTSCEAPTHCPDFTRCNSGGADVSASGSGAAPATGAISLCINSWLTDGIAQAAVEEPEGLRCHITMEHWEGKERVRDQPGECEETRDVFGEAAGEGGAEASGWRGAVALLEDVYVNQHGDVFNDTHHFYFGACAPLAEERRDPPRLFARFPYGEATEVMEVEELVNLAIGPLPQYQFLEQVYRMPLIIQLAALLPSLTKAPFLLGEHKVLHSALGRLLGISPWQRVVQPPRDGAHLLLVRRLIQPIHGHCGSPSRGTWSKIRASLRTPRGTPLFSRDWSTRIPPFPPPASLLAPKAYPVDWAVALGVPPASQAVRTVLPKEGYPGFSVRDVLSNEFWADHVVEVAETDASGAHDLFKRTVALVTAPGAALSAMLHMPRGAFVILLEPQDLPPQGSGPKTTVPLYRAEVVAREQEVLRAVRGLARAAGLHLAVVACPVGGASGEGGEGAGGGAPGAGPRLGPGLVCGTQPLADAVSWAASRVYRWRNLPGPPGSGEGPRAVELGEAIPGSGLEGKEGVGEFRAWQECVSTKGRWVRDPYPRPLPWPNENMYAGGGCDADAGYLSGDEARAAVRQWRAGNQSALRDWDRIRPGLRYVWSVDFTACQWRARGVPKRWEWREGNFIRFCDLIPGKKRRMVFIGDSLQDQMVADMLFTMLMDWPPLSHQESSALRYTPPDVGAWQAARNVSGASGYAYRVPSCVHMELVYLRNIHLRVAVASVPPENRWGFADWATDLRGQLEKAGMIIINRGAHFQMLPFFARDLAATCRFLRYTFPDKLIMFRSTVPGHPNCSRYEEPLAERQDLSRGSWYAWAYFREENERAKSIVESFGMVYLDVDAQTQFRADGHRGHNKKGATDCLHYCIPSAVDTWVQLFYNTLVQLKIS